VGQEVGRAQHAFMHAPRQGHPPRVHLRRLAAHEGPQVRDGDGQETAHLGRIGSKTLERNGAAREKDFLDLAVDQPFPWPASVATHTEPHEVLHREGEPDLLLGLSQRVLHALARAQVTGDRDIDLVRMGVLAEASALEQHPGALENDPDMQAPVPVPIPMNVGARLGRAERSADLVAQVEELGGVVLCHARSVAEDDAGSPCLNPPRPGASVSSVTPTSAAVRDRTTPYFVALVVLSTALVLASLDVIFFRAPVERTMGIVQKIFYFHVPSAVAMYVGASACFVGSVWYLVAPSELADAIGRAGAELAVVFGTIVLGSGSLWASKAWGTYWTWDPRLTTMMLSVLIYVAYLVLRAFAGDGEGERKFAAALGVIGAANLPIIHFSVQKWAGQHPTVITSKGGGLGHPDMKLALGLSFAALFTFVAALLWARVRGQLVASRMARLEEDVLDLDLDEGATR